MVVQVLLQISECPFDFVVRVGHSFAVFPLVGKEVRQVEVQTVHRSSQPLMRIVHLPVLVQALVVNRVLPLLFPFLVIPLVLLMKIDVRFTSIDV